MANNREIKTRITSVKSTAKITKALQLVSASKMQKATDRVKRSEIYAEALYEIVKKISNVTDHKSPLLRKPESTKNIGIVVIGTDRGFVGSMVANLTIETYKLAESLRKEFPKANIKGISVHKTGLKILEEAGVDSIFHFAEYKDALERRDLSAVFEFIIKKFVTGELDLIYIVSTKYINTLIQTVMSRKILPLTLDEAGSRKSEENSKLEIRNSSFLFEPSQEEILDKILPEYFETLIYVSVLSSIASEYSSRMVAMKNATDNANDIASKLTLKYNKNRQAAITQQIIEIVSGTV